MRKGRILAMDYGAKNIGLACSDELGVTTRPLPSVAYRNRAELISKLRRVIKDGQIEQIVVGMPLHMDGSSGDAASRVIRFIDLLSKEIPLPLTTVDERLSTVEALDLWHTMNRRQQHRYRTVDSLAAALILERYLQET